MKFSASTAALLGQSMFALAHMEMFSPAPLGSQHNPYATNWEDNDYNMISALQPDGSNFPCRGHHNLLGRPLGQSVAVWQAGRNYTFTIQGSAEHNGGSCQASLSYDQGNTFTVIKSYIGNCPIQREWEFTLPNDTPTGPALFAWSWFNQVGNREMYMNCASVTIRETGRNITRRDAAVPFSSRPNIFVANVGNGIGTLEGYDVEFPEPGPDVVRNSIKTADPVKVDPPINVRPTASTTQDASIPVPTGHVELWGQCGGNLYTGPTTCAQGLICDIQNEWYYQCIKGSDSDSTTEISTTGVSTTKISTTTMATATLSMPTSFSTTTAPTASPTAPDNTAKEWAQCGGNLYDGPTTCEEGLICNRQTEWYSQCIKG